MFLYDPRGIDQRCEYPLSLSERGGRLTTRVVEDNSHVIPVLAGAFILKLCGTILGKRFAVGGMCFNSPSSSLQCIPR